MSCPPPGEREKHSLDLYGHMSGNGIRVAHPATPASSPWVSVTTIRSPLEKDRSPGSIAAKSALARTTRGRPHSSTAAGGARAGTAGAGAGTTGCPPSSRPRDICTAGCRTAGGVVARPLRGIAAISDGAGWLKPGLDPSDTEGLERGGRYGSGAGCFFRWTTSPCPIVKPVRDAVCGAAAPSPPSALMPDTLCLTRCAGRPLPLLASLGAARGISLPPDLPPRLAPDPGLAGQLSCSVQDPPRIHPNSRVRPNSLARKRSPATPSADKPAPPTHTRSPQHY